MVYDISHFMGSVCERDGCHEGTHRKFRFNELSFLKLSDDECPVSNDYWPVTALQTHAATEFSCYEVQIIPILYRESVKNNMWKFGRSSLSFIFHQKWSNNHGLAHM